MAQSRSAEMATQEFSADEQAQFDAMRDADDAPIDTSDTQPQETQVVEPQEDAAAAGEAAEARQQQQRQQMVPHAALHEERERRKALDAALAEERRQRTLLEERTNLILQRFAPQQAQQPQAPAIPDLNTDPVGHIVGTLQAQQAEIERLRTGSQQNQQQMQAVGQISALQQRAQALEAQFVVEHPDYASAVGHLMSVRNRELEAIGYRDPAERAQMIQNEGLALAAQAMQRGQNPAELLYGLAGIRGWQAPAADAGETTAQPPPAGQPNGAERLATLSAGQRQARSIGNAAGSAPTAWTAEKLLRMSEKDFEAALKHPEAMALLGS